MKFKYLRVPDPNMLWGKHDVSKDYFMGVVSSGDTLINLEDMTYFDKEDNQWKAVPGDEGSES